MTDSVNHPKHYVCHGAELIDAIEGLDFLQGNAFKYLARAHTKGDYCENLRKARWYILRCVDAPMLPEMDEEAIGNLIPFLLDSIEKAPDLTAVRATLRLIPRDYDGALREISRTCPPEKAE